MHKVVKVDEERNRRAYKLHCFPEFSMQGDEGADSSGDKAFQFRKVGGSSGGRAPCGDFLMGTNAGNPVVSTSESEIMEIRRQAFAEGYAQGEKCGLDAGSRQVTPVIENFTQALAQLERIKRDIRLDAEKKMLDLALAVARKVVTCEIQNHRETVLGIIRNALEKVVDPKNIVVRLHPADFEYVTGLGTGLAEKIDHFEHITFEADESIPGGCLVETKMGEIDARIDQQFKIIEERLEAEYNRNRKKAV